MEWRRGCKMLIDQKLGCSQRTWSHDGKETLIDECVCENNLCNAEMSPIPETTSTTKSTTTDGI